MPVLASRASTMPQSSATPDGEKKRLSFIKRAFTHKNKESDFAPSPASSRPTTSASRPTSSASRPASSAISPVAVQAPKAGPIDATPKSPVETSPPKSALRRAQQASSDGAEDGMSRVTSNGTSGTNGSVETTTTSLSADDGTRSNSKGGIKWAAGFDASESRPRPRRESSAAAAARRRGSIYFKGTEGSYLEGVDAGVGSKARRLSQDVPKELLVEECSLEEHFSIYNRMRKEKIGEGGAALVQLMKSKTAGGPNDRVFAVKEFRPWDSEEEHQLEYERKIKSEYAIAKSCNHPNIVETFRLCTSHNNWFHVMELCALGDLNDLIKLGYFTQEDKDCMFKQLLRGVDFLHSRGIAHRDLKSENLLLTKEGCLKIADFGTSEVFCGPHPGMRNCRRPSIIEDTAEIKLCKPGMVGSRPYMAPEILSRAEYDPRCVDVWSCAVVYLSLCAGGTPWDEASSEVNNYNIYCSSWDDFESRFGHNRRIEKEGPLPKIVYSKLFARLPGAEAKTCVMGMLHPDPARRWRIKEALEFDMVKEAPCCQQVGYSDDIKTRQRKALHNHVPPEMRKKRP